MKQPERPTAAAVEHPWSAEKRNISAQYGNLAEQYRVWQAIVWADYFNGDADELDGMFERVGDGTQSQYYFNNLYLTSYQQIALNLTAGQPREQAIADAKAVLRNEQPVAPWSPTRKRT